MLIDSILRGYHLPVFYFHVIRVPGRHGENTRYEIIDGQQRVNSVTGFHKGEFTLLDPNGRNSRFARHLREEPCDWANLSFDQLPSYLEDKFLSSEVTVAEIVDATTNEARDLFVRLQQGSDLSAQERRDALPGEFGGEVARIAGRRGLSHGHALFQEIMRMKPRTDRGQTRQFVAQLIAAFFQFRSSRRFIDLNKASIDQHYYDYLELGGKKVEINQFETVLEDLHQSLRGWKGPKLPNHLILHLLIMWYQLDGHYTNSWKSGVQKHVEDFMFELRQANLQFRQGHTTEFHSGYGGRIRNNSDRRDTIGLRHQFFMEWMHRRIELTPLDQRRSFNVFEREFVYLRSHGVCAYADNIEICGDAERMDFREAHVHHTQPHSTGGRTDLNNAALTHAQCNLKISNNFVTPTDGQSRVDRSVIEGAKDLELSNPSS